MGPVSEQTKPKPRDNVVPFSPYQADENQQASRRAGELLHSVELRYLNEHYASGTVPASAGAGSEAGLTARLLAPLKRKVAAFIWGVLDPHLSAEREFNAKTVQFLNDVAKYVDARDASNFWELIRKIDYDVQKSLERIERIHDQFSASQLSSERRTTEAINRDLGSLRTAAAQQAEQLKVLDSVTRGMESIIARLKPSQSSLSSVDHKGTDTDYSYLLLENRFRGSEAEIAKRIAIYPPIFAAQKMPVLEIGCGRGELQAAFKAAGVASYGVDMDKAMVERCQELGFDARLEDGLKHLESLPDDSLGGVIAIQVVEHLTRAQLERLFTLCRAKVAKGGKIIFETINPRSLLALSASRISFSTLPIVVSPATAVTWMSTCPVRLVVPAYTSSPGCASIGTASPVSEAWLMLDVPAMMRPSTGRFSP
ncbi:MAG: class I SAM-dependent methyltransferase, partial [Proteobacteria bacterium]|nr:class I SAM-dependent methyltransferase [Pseudomonadota bacterium]